MPGGEQGTPPWRFSLSQNRRTSGIGNESQHCTVGDPELRQDSRMLRTFHVVTFRGSYLPKDTHICILISFSEIHGTHCNMYSFHVSNNFFFFFFRFKG